MPAVTVCDSVTAALRYSLSVGQTKSTEDVSISLASSASRILQTEIQYEETDSLQSAVLEQLKTKYIYLSLSNFDQSENGKVRENIGSICRKNTAISKMRGPSLPEPKVVLYDSEKVQLGWNGTFPVGAGMFNVGNTCYLNSTLQALFHVPALINWLLSDSHHNTKCEQNGERECLTCAMAKTLQFSHEKSGNAIKPFYIINKLKIICRTMVAGQQEDAHEFLRYLLEGMERAYLNRHKAGKLDCYSKETTPVNQIFGGYIRTEVKCLQCRHVSTTFQHFQDLLVDIRKASTLDEALIGYFSREKLDNNDYKCEACKSRVPATKQFSLERPPKVLCVQLKRFSVLGGKISKHIDFKPTVDMGPYLWREPGEPIRKINYKLTSMVTHVGSSVNCGHYTAIAQVSTGQYYSFDDACVRSITISNVLSTNAYIMIFEMEPQSQNQLPNSHVPKLNGLSNIKSLSNGLIKPMNPKPSTSGLLATNRVSNGSAARNRDIENSSIDPQVLLSNGSQIAQQKTNTFIGPELPQKMLEKSQPNIVIHNKNVKAFGGNCLVPYDRSSDEEENAPTSNSKNHNNLNTSNIKSSTNNTTNGILKTLPKETKDTSKVLVISKSETKSSKSICINQKMSLSISSPQNGSSNHSTNSTLKYQNGKSENNSNLKPEINGKDKCYNPVRVKTGIIPDDKIPTKADRIVKGWRREVSEDVPSSTSSATPSNWVITDNKNENKKSNHIASINSTPSAAAPRNFNGTNRSETVSNLRKMSHRGYGTSVTNWNGDRTHLDREVDNERREARKRHFNPDDEEMDRGRSKKVKSNREYDTRSNPGFNYFQSYSGKHRSQSNGGGGGSGNSCYRRPHNTSKYDHRYSRKNRKSAHHKYSKHSQDYRQHR